MKDLVDEKVRAYEVAMDNLYTAVLILFQQL